MNPPDMPAPPTPAYDLFWAAVEGEPAVPDSAPSPTLPVDAYLTFDTAAEG